LKKEKEHEQKLRAISIENSFKFLSSFEKATLKRDWKQIALELFGPPVKEKVGIWIYDTCPVCSRGGRGARKAHVNSQGVFCKRESCEASESKGGMSWDKILRKWGREDLFEPEVPGFLKDYFKNAIFLKNFEQARQYLSLKVNEVVDFLSKPGRVFTFEGVQGIGKTTFAATVVKKLLLNKEIKRVLWLYPSKLGWEKLEEKAKELRERGIKAVVAPSKVNFCEKIAEFRAKYAGFPEIILCGGCKKRRKCQYWSEDFVILSSPYRANLRL
jgi:hypothetical protein